VVAPLGDVDPVRGPAVGQHKLTIVCRGVKCGITDVAPHGPATQLTSPSRMETLSHGWARADGPVIRITAFSESARGP
jgi:hypothetical protein